MFSVTHFSKLDSHKRPVLQLYRRVLRHATHLPVEIKAIVFNGARETFHRNKKTMTPHAARDQIQYAYSWEKTLREACIAKNDGSIDIINDRIKKHLAMIHEKRRKIDAGWWKSQNFYGSPMNTVEKYDSSLLENSPGLQLLLKMDNRLHTFRARAIRSLYRSNELSRKEKIDNFYIDIFVVPQIRVADYKKKNAWRRDRETRFRTVRVSFLKTPIGSISRLLVPGQGRRTSLLRALKIRDALADDTDTKMEANENMIELARHEAQWEKMLGSNKSLEDLQNEWTLSFRIYKTMLREKRSRKWRINRHYREILVAKKKYLDNILIGTAKRNQIKWAKYKDPFIHKIRDGSVKYRSEGMYN